MKIISSKNAPTAVGPYSQAIEANGFVFCSGQIGIDPKTGEFAKDVVAQTTQVINNLAAVLEAAGLGLDNVVKTTIFLADMKDYAIVNDTYTTFFTKNKPARATVQVARLPKDALVEIEAIAAKP